MLDADGRIVLWSPTSQDILGWSYQQANGHHLREFLGPDEHVAGPGIYRALLQSGHWHGRLTLRHQNGRTLMMDCRASLLRGTEHGPLILANLVETAELRAVEQDLAALDALFSTSPLGIGILDTHLRFLRVNESLSRLHGIPAGELTGKSMLDIMPPSTGQKIYKLQENVLSSGQAVIDLVSGAPDGKGARSVSFGRLTDRAGQTLGVSYTVMDITERREALEKIERARQRLALLDDIGTALADLLDVQRIADALAQALVPRFADYCAVHLLGTVLDGGELPTPEQVSSTPLTELSGAAKDDSPNVRRLLRKGQNVPYDPGSTLDNVLNSGVPHLVGSQRELLLSTFPGDPRVRAALDLGVHSVMTLPLRARGTVLGVLVLFRAGQRSPFEHDDLVLAGEIAGRSGTSLDNARLYAREREGALMLQRSLLPQQVPSPHGIQIGYRYVPGSTGTEVGGDWFDVIPLAGGRVAFVVGDVMGHGLRAAAAMGQLRTAVRTLAALDLPPAELLRRINDLGDDFIQGEEDSMTATCVYAVYDPSVSECTIAMAGHVPPVLLAQHQHTGQWEARLVDLPTGTPLGVGGDVVFEERQLRVPDGGVLVLYTDGLVENRGEDITDGLNRLCEVLAQVAGPAPLALEDLCDEVINAFGPGNRVIDDDIALLTARLGGLPENSAVSWSFPTEGSAAWQARSAVRETLLDWGLEAVLDNAVLLVSELVTNSLRYARGPIGVRVMRGNSLLVEVSDTVPTPPHERYPTTMEEGGRGIQLVSRQAFRWGTRHRGVGKTVWFELQLPG